MDNTGSDWIVGPIKLRGNQELVFADGVTIRAKRGIFRSVHDCLFEAVDIADITIRGEGNVTLEMNKKDYLGPAQKYQLSEWRHTISLRGCTNVKISNLTLRSSGGDGIYVGTGVKKDGLRYCKDVVIDKIRAYDHNRQGVSVISCENLLIKDSVFNETSGTAPFCGIDFEPNRPDEVLINCVVDNCEFNDNKSLGILFYLCQFDETTKPVSVTVRNARVKGNNAGAMTLNLIAPSKKKQYDGFIRFENCEFDGKVTVLNQRDDGMELSFKDCTVKAALSVMSECDAPVKMALDNVKIEGAAGNPPFKFDSAGHQPKITGKIITAAGAFDLDRWSAGYKIDPSSLGKGFVPAKLDISALTADGTKKAAPPKGLFQLRMKFKFLQFAREGEEVKVKLTNKVIGARTLGSGEIKVTAPDGKVILTHKLDSAAGEIKFTAPAAGIYQFDGDTKGNVLTLHSELPGQGFSTEEFGILGSHGRLYFEVPAGLTEVWIKINGQPGEPMSVRLFNAQNQQVHELSDVVMAKYLKYTRSFPEKDEIWCLEVTRMVEDGGIQFGKGLVPVIGFSPETLLRKK